MAAQRVPRPSGITPPGVWHDRGVALNYGTLVGGTHLTRNDCVPPVPNRTSATCLARNLLLHQVPQKYEGLVTNLSP
jgi:hypothetical protein